MKNHKEKITEILNYSATPTESINSYINKVTYKNDKWWIVTYTISVFALIILIGTKRPSGKEIVEASKPVIENMQIKYQNRLNSITDSLINIKNK